MDINSVPQDNSSTYAKNKKAIYAKHEDGHVGVVGSSGWEAEETVTKQALQDLDELAQEAYALVKNGEKSPLYFHMFAIRMNLQLLADATSFFKWSVQRDFKPKVFAKISEKRLLSYAQAMGKTPQELQLLPEENHESN